MKRICVAIDGPASSGKSTIAKQLAKKYHYIYLDTGAMYRCVTLLCIQEGVFLEDQKAVEQVAATARITFEVEPQGDQFVFLNGINVTERIRQVDITEAVSLVSSYEKVREHLVAQQKEYALSGGIIMDGRDIGTVVMPNAELKIFMGASVQARAKRRQLENEKRGIQTTLSEIEEAIVQRDYKDSHREHSPLKKADDAIDVDTSALTIDEVVDKVSHLIDKVLDR